jgi:hypothetical protein
LGIQRQQVINTELEELKKQFKIVDRMVVEQAGQPLRYARPRFNALLSVPDPSSNLSRWALDFDSGTIICLEAEGP